ncbi:hypothetical protein [Corallococcus carmarthensis]|uniref:hypothetical protein n=1 Tax=Corallococcus carmarthensis TaxID=2316728 RepID=UPI00148E524B|nr:hypothetical protein [Corallococcus carmarthensis]NOK21690.1 hypothetical protein [Corallococcus carmarthensis]
MRHLRRDFGLALLLFGAMALLPGLYFSLLTWAASPRERAADAVACEPTASVQSCIGSTCGGLSWSEWALEHDEISKSDYRLVRLAGLLFLGAGLVLLGMGGMLLRSGGAPARAGSE